VIADEMALSGELPRDLWVCLGPATLDEERGDDVVPCEGFRQTGGRARLGRSVGMLGVECKRDLTRRPGGR
jgi:hypothetical protein